MQLWSTDFFSKIYDHAIELYFWSIFKNWTKIYIRTIWNWTKRYILPRDHHFSMRFIESWISRDKLHFCSTSKLSEYVLLVRFYLESGPKLQFNHVVRNFGKRQWTKTHVKMLCWAKNHCPAYNRRRSYQKIVNLNLSFWSSHSFCCATGHLLLALLYLIFSSTLGTLITTRKLQNSENISFFKIFKI